MNMEGGPQNFPEQDRAQRLLLVAQRFVDLEKNLTESDMTIRGIEEELSDLTSRERSLANAPAIGLLNPGEKDPKDEYEAIQKRFEFLRSRLKALEENHKTLLLFKKKFLEDFDKNFPKEQRQFEIIVQNLQTQGNTSALPDISKHTN